LRWLAPLAIVLALASTAHAQPGLRAIPRRVNFGKVQLRNNPPPIVKEFTIVNRSKTNTINATVTGAVGAFQSQPLSLSLRPQDRVVVQVAFNPPDQAKYTEVVTITPNVGNPIYVVLSGRARGVRPASIPTPTPTGALTPTPTPTSVPAPSPTLTPTPTPPNPTPTPTLTPTSTPTPIPTVSSTPTPTPPPIAKVNAAIMVSFLDQPSTGSGFGAMTTIVEDPTMPDKQVIQLTEDSSAGLPACIVIPIEAPLNTLINVYNSSCVGGGGEMSDCPPAIPHRAVAQVIANYPGGDPTEWSDLYSVGISLTPKSVPIGTDPTGVSGANPNDPVNIIDSEGYGLFASFYAGGPLVGPYVYQVSGCNGHNCPTTPEYYSSNWNDVSSGPMPAIQCVKASPIK
jgi:hypothetical protein